MSPCVCVSVSFLIHFSAADPNHTIYSYFSFTKHRAENQRFLLSLQQTHGFQEELDDLLPSAGEISNKHLILQIRVFQIISWKVSLYFSKLELFFGNMLVNK